jgi:hypothetical protein
MLEVFGSGASFQLIQERLMRVDSRNIAFETTSEAQRLHSLTAPDIQYSLIRPFRQQRQVFGRFVGRV